MKAKRIIVGALGIVAAMSLLLMAACGGGSKESVITEMLDCQAENDPYFEESMLMMFPSADDIDEAKEQYIAMSQAASMDELKEARDYVCGGESNGDSPDSSSSGAADPTEEPEWEETVSFSVVWDEIEFSEPHLVEISVEKCEWVRFHLTASENVDVSSRQPGGEGWGRWGELDDLNTIEMAEESGVWTLAVESQWGSTTPTDVTVSWLIRPPRFEC